MHCLGVGKRGVGLRQLPRGLVERRLKGPRIDLKKQLAFPDESAFLIGLSHQVAGDLRPDVSICESIKRAYPVAVNRDIFLGDRNYLDVERSHSACAMFWAHSQNGHGHNSHEQHSPNHEPAS